MHISGARSHSPNLLLNLVQDLIIYLKVGVWKGNHSSFLGFRFGGIFVLFGLHMVFSFSFW